MTWLRLRHKGGKSALAGFEYVLGLFIIVLVAGINPVIAEW